MNGKVHGSFLFLLFIFVCGLKTTESDEAEEKNGAEPETLSTTPLGFTGTSGSNITLLFRCRNAKVSGKAHGA